MTQKAILITGGARRVGAALARGFAQAGYDIALHYNQSAEEATALIHETGGKIYQADLTEKGAAQQLIAAVKSDFSHLSVLVNNASTFRRAHLKDTTPTTIDEDISINLTAPLNLMREFGAKVDHGCIINMLDTAIYKHHPAHFSYLVAKKGLAEATKMAAREFMPDIRVNGICPGYVLPTESDPAFEPKTLANKPSVEQIVQAALTLVQSSAYTGQFLNIDGGENIL